MGNGSDWLRKAFGRDTSEFGGNVADLLDAMFAGIYHIDHGALSRVDWSNEHFILLNLSNRNLATYDGNLLTALVVLSHDRCIRVEVNPASPSSLQLLFHPRERAANRVAQRMPTLEEHVEALRKYFR